MNDQKGLDDNQCTWQWRVSLTAPQEEIPCLLMLSSDCNLACHLSLLCFLIACHVDHLVCRSWFKWHVFLFICCIILLPRECPFLNEFIHYADFYDKMINRSPGKCLQTRVLQDLMYILYPWYHRNMNMTTTEQIKAGQSDTKLLFITTMIILRDFQNNWRAFIIHSMSYYAKSDMVLFD